VFFYLLATLFLILTCKRNKSIYLLLMAGAHGVACLTSEAGYLMALATPLKALDRRALVFDYGSLCVLDYQ
jgi:hypothetical protein